MNRVFRFVILPLFLCLATVLPASGRREALKTEEQSIVVQASGRVRLVGSSPFTNIVITGPDREWYIEGEDEQKLRDFQHRTITVEGTETVTQLISANGRPAGERRTLRDIVIIEIE